MHHCRRKLESTVFANFLPVSSVRRDIQCWIRPENVAGAQVKDREQFPATPGCVAGLRSFLFLIDDTFPELHHVFSSCVILSLLYVQGKDLWGHVDDTTPAPDKDKDKGNLQYCSGVYKMMLFHGLR
ncbi:hypothetical protein L195_g027670, partial [Trifolium pratense]